VPENQVMLKVNVEYIIKTYGTKMLKSELFNFYMYHKVIFIINDYIIIC